VDSSTVRVSPILLGLASDRRSLGFLTFSQSGDRPHGQTTPFPPVQSASERHLLDRPDRFRRSTPFQELQCLGFERVRRLEEFLLPPKCLPPSRPTDVIQYLTSNGDSFRTSGDLMRKLFPENRVDRNAEYRSQFLAAPSARMPLTLSRAPVVLWGFRHRNGTYGKGLYKPPGAPKPSGC
jgi:hypothetical protein